MRPDVAVSVAIYGDAESFLSGEGPVRTLSLAQNSPVARAFVLNLPPGRYAIVAWQDMNGDGLPGRAPFEAASDPTGFSRAGEVRTETPAFDAAAFDLGSSGVTQRITLQAH